MADLVCASGVGRCQGTEGWGEKGLATTTRRDRSRRRHAVPEHRSRDCPRRARMSGKDSTRSLTNHWYVNLWPRSVNVGSIDYLLLLTTCMLIESLVVIDVAPTVVTISFVLTAGVLPPHPQSHVDKLLVLLACTTLYLTVDPSLNMCTYR